MQSRNWIFDPAFLFSPEPLLASLFSSTLPPLAVCRANSEVESRTPGGGGGGSSTAGAKNIHLALARYKWRFVAIIEFDLFVGAASVVHSGGDGLVNEWRRDGVGGRGGV